MTYFKDDSGNQIILDEDFALTTSANNIFNFAIKGNYSTSFKVPNNSFYRKAFQYYSPLQSNNGFISTLFNYVKNGNILSRGYLVLEREDNDFLYFFFISGNANWITKITGSIKDLDYDDYALTYIDTAINTTQNNTSGIVFPLIDWAYKFQKANINYRRDNNSQGADNTDYNNCFNDFYPCVYLSSVLKYILKYFGFQAGGNLLNEQLYKSLIITPDSGQIMRSPKFYNDRHSVITISSNFTVTPTQVKIPLNTLISDGVLASYNTSTQRYIASKSALYEIILNLNVNGLTLWTINIFRNGISSGGLSVLFQQLTINTIENTIFGTNTNGELSIPLVSGDYIEIYIKAGFSDRGLYNASGNVFPSTGGSGGGGSIVTGDIWTISVGGTLAGVVVNPNDLICALKSSPPGDLTGWAITHTPLQINVAGTFIEIAPRKNMNYFGGGNDTIRPSDILPNISCIDFIKMVNNYFCCITNFDQYTSTINFNLLDSFNMANAYNWSEYIQKYENDFTINTSKNNFIRVTQPNDKLLDGYNSSNYISTIDKSNNIVPRNNIAINYGESLLSGNSSSFINQINNNLFQIPLGGSLDKMSLYTSLLTTAPSLVDLSDSGSKFYFNSVANAGGASQLAQFQCLDSTNHFTLTTRQVIRIFASGIYDGYAIVESFSQITISSQLYNVFTCYLTFTSNATGYFFVQNVSFKSNQSRLLYNVSGQSISSIGNQSNITVNYNATDNILSTIAWAYYSKPTVTFAASNYKQGVNLGKINAIGYNDISVVTSYFKFLQRILKAPYVKIQVYLPEREYAKFKFDNFILIITGSQQRYLLVDSIQNYKDSKTLCQIYAYLII